ncbi:hypothetical protein [Nitrosophilus kaiyonis]|uniref:hypothetical protein n=1 Tax=Nitrosophilus kaiyonis TaxID=2930200 RepID=UPI0024936B60|nr:hypothetical protein [Nitrosophilus kaiyonis]
MKKIFFIFTLFIFLVGCANRGINIYINDQFSSIKNSLVHIVDQRKNKNIIGYIYKNGKIEADITFSTDLEKYFAKKLENIDKKADIYIKKLSLIYNKSKLTGENLEGSILIKVEFEKDGVKKVRIIDLKESRWIAPINSAKSIEDFTKKLIDEAVVQVYKILKS